VEPSLIVIGISARTAPVAVRERFAMDDAGRRQALEMLAHAEGIAEAAVLATCERTEFILWAPDASLAADSALTFLTREYRLRSAEWEHFHRLVDERAVAHLMRLLCGLDSIVPGDPEIPLQVRSAWMQAQAVGACGAVLDGVFDEALSAAERIGRQAQVGAGALSVAAAAVALARQIFGALEQRRILLLGAGHLAEQVSQLLVETGARSVCVLDRTASHASQLAGTFGLATAPMRDRPTHLAAADIVISAVPASELALTLPEIEAACRHRGERPLLLIDAGLPRNIDPAARDLPGVLLHDLDALQALIRRTHVEPAARVAEAEKLIASAARLFCSKLEAQRIVPIVVALRQKLDELCRQELEAFRRESGPLADEPALQAFAGRLSQRLAGSLVREIKELPDRLEQERLTGAVQRLFRLHAASAAGAR
jgi:glutamyl-tRNA reductase